MHQKEHDYVLDLSKDENFIALPTKNTLTGLRHWSRHKSRWSDKTSHTVLMQSTNCPPPKNVPGGTDDSPYKSFFFFFDFLNKKQHKYVNTFNKIDLQITVLYTKFEQSHGGFNNDIYQ